MNNVMIAVLSATVAASAHADVLGIGLNPGSEADVSSPILSETLGVSGSLGIEVERDEDGKLSDAGLCSVDLLVQSGGLYSLGGTGILRLSNLGISLDEKGGQEYFFNETSGVPQPGDYAGFLDTGATAGLTGDFGIDLDGDGTEEITRDFSTVAEEFRMFDFEAIITRDGGSDLYTLETFFQLFIEVGFDGQLLPITMEFSGGGTGTIIPAPGTFAAVSALGLVGMRRRR